MNYQKEIKINEFDFAQISKWLSLPNYDNANPINLENYQGEENTLSYTATFGNGYEMDIKCCGCDNCASWIEAVLFKNGVELKYTECMDEILQEFQIEDNGDIYTVIVSK